MSEVSQTELGRSRPIWDKASQRRATLPLMSEEQIRENVRACLEIHRKAGKFKGPADLARLVNSTLARIGAETHNVRPHKKTISDQTASNWIRGEVIPDWNQLAALALAIDVPGDQILFGNRRSDQLKREREYLVRVSDEELKMLTIFRESSKAGQRTILKQAKIVADESPSPAGDVHHLRRKNDQSKQ